MEWNRWLRRCQKALLWCFRWTWVRYWVRAGYASKGIVYFIVGFFVLRSALGNPVPIVGTEEALLVLLRQPLGTTVVTALAFGLCGYGFWRFIQGIVDPEHDRELGIRSIGQRVGYLASGGVYTNLAYEAVDFSWDSEKVDADATNAVLARILSFQFGEVLVALVAIAIFAVGAIYIYGALSGEFISEFKRSCELLDRQSYRWLKKTATYLAQVGYTARGIAIVIIGIGFVRAALTSRVEYAGGMQEALQALLEQSYGTEGLVLIALGFLAYGLYMVFAAFYRRFQVNWI